MSLDRELLRHARELAERAPRRPKPANIRRAISAAYYAVFHLLTRAAARHFIGGEGDAVLVARIARTFDHGKIMTASKGFASGNLPQQLQPPTVRNQLAPKLIEVATEFVFLQNARHLADYDSEKPFTRGDAVDAVTRAEAVFQAWETVEATHEAGLYLACFYLWDIWNKPPR